MSLLELSLAVTVGGLLGGGLSAAWFRSQLAAARAEARTDSLTGISNRRAFEERLAAEHDSAVRNGQPYAVILLDLDGFKIINDTLGHAAGDALLQSVAKRVSAAIRPGDVPARYGGDEFVILCPGTDPVTAQALAEQMRSVVFRRDDDVTAQFSVAGWTVSESAQQVLERADADLRKAKRQRRTQ